MGQLNPTRQEIINAHEALEELCNRLPGTRYAKMAILAALPPKPRPTMAEVEWDDNEHFLAEAEHPDWGKVAMLRESGLIIFVQPIEKKIGDIQVARVEELTPTGKRYTLTEVQE
ncbi:hypothetical protein [Corynebacterium rhinophilum]|uniref:hypothetical protein n=1 Tax=Corynebacterium rhinophilum TaxID=3050197 RepID=UPI00254C5C2B|nr:hypothetical protein [Corynebacterium sp. MSK192]MDK8698415.1 hypothetical protein [Corynebacterium sp. MSK192]